MISHLHNRIRMLRRAANLSQGELAIRAGVSREVISRFEKNGKDINLSTLQKILAVFNCDLEISEKQHEADPNIVYVKDWVGFIDRMNKRLVSEMREARSVEENIQKACFIDGSQIEVLSWGEM